MGDNLVTRIGTFFILVGLGLLLIFIGSIISQDVHGIYLLLSFTALVVGFLCRRNRPGPQSGRFGTIRRVGERNRQRREDGIKKRRNRGNPMGRRRPGPAAGSETEEDNGSGSY